MKFNIMELRAIIGEEKFKSLIKDSKKLKKICETTIYKTWFNIDTKLANSYEIQSMYGYNKLTRTADISSPLIIHKKILLKNSELIVDNNDETYDFIDDYFGNNSYLLPHIPNDIQLKNINIVSLKRCDLKDIPQCIKNTTITGTFDISMNSITSLENAPKSIEGDMHCEYNNIQRFDGNTTHVRRNMYCQKNNITSLDNSPQYVGGGFNCSNNQISTLKGSPLKVGAHFDCSNNLIMSLEGITQTINGSILCNNNNELISLKGSPKIVTGSFNCDSCKKLTSLIGAPDEVYGNFTCENTAITSLVGAPKIVDGYFSCSDCKLESLDGIPTHISGDFYCKNNPTKFTVDEIRKLSNISGDIIL